MILQNYSYLFHIVCRKLPFRSIFLLKIYPKEFNLRLKYDNFSALHWLLWKITNPKSTHGLLLPTQDIVTNLEKNKIYWFYKWKDTWCACSFLQKKQLLIKQVFYVFLQCFCTTCTSACHLEANILKPDQPWKHTNCSTLPKKHIKFFEGSRT